MSNENKKVIDMTATENEKRVRISGREWDEYQELKESNKNLIAERDQLKERLAKEQNDTLRVHGWWKEEENKARALALVLKALGGSISVATLADRIAK